MEYAMVVGLALGVVALGVAMTVLIASAVPEKLFARVQQHGRFTGLGSAQDGGAQRGVGVQTRQPRGMQPAL